MTDKNLAAQGYWDATNKVIGFTPMGENYPIVLALKKYFGSESNAGKSVFEIGCFPGRFMYHFGRLGFELNGIDKTPYLPKMEEWLKNSGFALGSFVEGDFFAYNDSRQYDIVFSSGFIEHFTNFETVIKRHFSLIKPGGYVFITAPNFAGSIQKFLHSLVDRKNLERHYLPSMDVEKWKAVAKDEGFEVLAGRYVGGFNFWIDRQKRNFLQKITAKFIILLCKVLPMRFLPNSQIYSPEIILIARKK